MKLVRNIFVRFALLVFFIFGMVTLVSLQLDQNRKQSEIAALNGQIQEYEDYIAELQASLDAPMDDEYVAEIAREKLGLRYPQEVIFYSDDAD